MIIRTAKSSDCEKLITLWQSVFGDSEETIKLFFEHCFVFENTVVCYDNDVVVSMLFMLENEIVIDGIIHKAYYIYAAATDNSYRKQGIMSDLLAFSEKIAAERKISFLFLRPANEKLYDYYEKNGFVTAFCESKKTLSAGDIESFADISYNYVRWSESAIKLSRIYSENTMAFENGYAEVLVSGNTAEASKIITNNLKDLLREISAKIKADIYKVSLPAIDNNDLVKTGMIKPVKLDSFKKNTKIYLGITLE